MKISIFEQDNFDFPPFLQIPFLAESLNSLMPKLTLLSNDDIKDWFKDHENCLPMSPQIFFEFLPMTRAPWISMPQPIHSALILFLLLMDAQVLVVSSFIPLEPNLHEFSTVTVYT